jgi:formamidopyrimidine-DNA glycosylase
VRETLEYGIRFGGSSISSYTAPDGTLASAQDEHPVYARASQSVREAAEPHRDRRPNDRVLLALPAHRVPNGTTRV